MAIGSKKKFGVSFLTILLLTATSLAVLGNIGGSLLPTQVSASTGSFSGRTTSVDLEGDDFQVTTIPAMTILVHGLGGDASHWSNNGDGKFSFDERSLIEKLRDQNGANVFWAKMFNDNTHFYFYIIDKLNQLEKYETSSLTSVSQLTSSHINKHMIIVFEASYDASHGSHYAMYDEFEKMTLAVAHDYGYITGGIYPRINLIGHSRGGLTNMEFANHYPRLISDMYSMGTPFNGSNFGRVNLFAHSVSGHIDSEFGTGLYDINDVDLQNRLRDDWAINQQNGRGSHIRFFPMAGYSTLGMIADVAGGVWGTIASTLLALSGPLSFATLVTTVSTIIWGIEADMDYPQTSWSTINDAFYDAFSGWAFLWVGRNTEIQDDLLVHRDSQKATGYIGITEYYEKMFHHNGIFGDENFDTSRTATPDIAIVHNLETRDDDFISWIIAKINMNINIFDLSIVENKITINGLLDSASIPPNSVLFIPENILINNYYIVVKKITSNAFVNQINITQISIPLTVTSIGEHAFKGCNNLTIYPEVANKPSGWDKAWNSSNRPVVWGNIHHNNNYQTREDSIYLASYDYPAQYNNFTPINSYIETESGEQVLTKRLRTGVINYDGVSYLTMSAKNKNATSAYLEYEFPHELTKVDYQLALWSSDESLIQNSSIRLEGYYNDDWITLETFSAKTMSQNKDVLINYSTTFKEPTNTFRFIIETNQVNNNNNRGRMVIGDLTFEEIYDSHVHSHDTYMQHSALYHAIFCECGDFILAHHTVSETYNQNGHLFGICIYCGEVVDLGTTPVVALGGESNVFSGEETVTTDEKQYYYIEKSYINEDGILVLCPSDVEDYLNGLWFIDFT